MILLDALTMTLLSGLIVTLCGVVFVFNTVLRRGHAAARLWSIAFVFGILEALAYLVYGVAPDARWALAVGNGSLAIALGMLWSGTRRANRRAAWAWLPPLVGIAVAATVPLHPADGYWAGSVELFAATSVLAGLAAAETLRGRLRRDLNARIMTVVYVWLAVFYAARTVGALILGYDDPLFLTALGTFPTTLITVGALVVATVALSNLQLELFRDPEDGDDVPGSGSAYAEVDGVLGPRTFRSAAESWLLRSVRDRTPLVLLVADLANLEEVDVAFGRETADNAVRLLGRSAVVEAPTAALVGHLARGRYAVLLPVIADADVESVAERISIAVLDTTIDDADRFRGSVRYGIAGSRTAGARYGSLLDAAVADLERRETGPVRGSVPAR